MKIKRIETFCTQFLAFVRVTVEDGTFGWGQVAPYNADITAQVLHRQVAPWSLGADAYDIDALMDRDPGEGAQVSGLLSEPRDGRTRHRAVGPARHAARARACASCWAARRGRCAPTRRR